MAKLDLVKECLLAKRDGTTTSVPAINNWIEAEKKKVIEKHVMKAALKKGVETGVLIQVKASYKLSAEAQKSLAKKPSKNVVKKSPSKRVVLKRVCSIKNCAKHGKKTTSQRKNLKRSVTPKKVARTLFPW